MILIIKFKTNKARTLIVVTLVSVFVSIIFTTGFGVGLVDIVDHFTNQYAMIVLGIAETIAFGWFFKTTWILKEVNKNTNKLKMPKWLFFASIKVIIPLSLAGLLVWQIISLFQSGGRYDASYPLYAEIIAGWLIVLIVMISGPLISLIMKKSEKGQKILAAEKEELTWEDQEKTVEEQEVSEVSAN